MTGCGNEYSYLNASLGGQAIGTIDELYLFIFIGKLERNFGKSGHFAFNYVNAEIYLVKIDKEGNNSGKIINYPKDECSHLPMIIFYNNNKIYMLNYKKEIYELSNDEFILTDLNYSTLLKNENLNTQQYSYQDPEIYFTELSKKNGAICFEEFPGIMTFSCKFDWDNQKVFMEELPGFSILNDIKYLDIKINVEPLLYKPIEIDIPYEYIPKGKQLIPAPGFSEIIYHSGNKI